jgi:hypothetical protein
MRYVMPRLFPRRTGVEHVEGRRGGLSKTGTSSTFQLSMATERKREDNTVRHGKLLSSSAKVALLPYHGGA